MKQITYQLSELPEIIVRLMPEILKHKVLALHGELGAGKTTFVAALSKYLGTEETASSPTFSLINQYTFTNDQQKEQTIYHSDWYRLNDAQEAREAGIEDMLQDDYFLCIIEWSEKAPELLPNNTLQLYFQLGENQESRILSLTE